MLLSSFVSPRYRPYEHQHCHVNRRCSGHSRSSITMFFLECLVVLLTVACSAGPTTPPSSHVTTTSSSTNSQPTSPPTKIVASGTVLYQANWSHSLDGWKGSSGWSIVQGDLQGICGATTTSLTVPYLPPVTNYVVEVRLQVVRLLHENGGFYSIFARQVPGIDGYQAGGSDLKGPGPRPNGSNAQLQIFVDPMADMAPGSFHPSDYDPKTQWHTYQVDVQDNEATLEVDGGPSHSASSAQTQTLSHGPLGLSCGSVVLRVSSFRILAL